MIQFVDHLIQAFHAIKENRVRTIMSVTGIAVGIASVVVVGVISQSGREYIYSELETYGLNTLWIYRRWEGNNPFSNVRPGSGITNDDLAILQKKSCCPSVNYVTPSVFPEKWMINLRYGNNFTISAVEGIGKDSLAVNKDQIASGRNFRDEDIKRKKNVALITPNVHKTLFGLGVSPIGKKIQMGNMKFTIIGLLQAKNREFLNAIGATNGFDINNRVLIPYTTYQQILGTKDVNTLVAEAKSSYLIDSALEEIVQLLRRNHNDNYVYNAESMREWINTANGILSTVSLIGGVAAVVSLLIGGIGIFNIMSSSVMERTREIGIRKALGATQNNILTQFLLESMFIGIIGGLLGAILSAIIVSVLVLMSGLTLISAWYFLVVAIFVSLAVGLMAGYLPARHASNLSPVEALRYD